MMKILIGIVSFFIFFEVAWLYQKKPLKINISNKLTPHKDISYESYFIKNKDIENFIFNLIRFYSNKIIINI